MTQGLDTILFPVRDIAAAKALFSSLLSAEPYLDQPYYVAFNAGGQDIGLDPNGHRRGMTGAVPYWKVDDIAASTKTLLDGGATVVEDAKDVGGGKLVAMLKDADGNMIGLTQAGS
jgi:predicted enzyme related to lactoylglutathione lyase